MLIGSLCPETRLVLDVPELAQPIDDTQQPFALNIQLVVAGRPFALAVLLWGSRIAKPAFRIDVIHVKQVHQDSLQTLLRLAFIFALGAPVVRNPVEYCVYNEVNRLIARSLVEIKGPRIG